MTSPWAACRFATSPRPTARHSLSTTRRRCVHAVAKRRASSTTAWLLRRSRSCAARWPASPSKRVSASTSRPAGNWTSSCAAGVPASRVILHGNNKSHDELERALAVGVHRVIVDNFDEIDRLRALVSPDASPSLPRARDARRRGAHSRVRAHRPRGHQIRVLRGDGRRSPGDLDHCARCPASTVHGVHAHIGSPDLRRGRVPRDDDDPGRLHERR